MLAMLLVIAIIMSVCPIAPLRVDAAGATLNTNLIQWGNGEGGSTAMGSHGWKSNFYISNWNAWPTGDLGVAAHGDSYYMALTSRDGNFTYSSECYQDIDISALSSAISANSIVANFSGWMIRTGTASGVAKIQMQGLDSGGNPVSVVSEANYDSPSGWKNAVFKEAVLPGTSKIRVTLIANGICNGVGAFDDLSLILTSNTTLAPTISTIPEQAIVSGGNTGTIAFTVEDADTNVDSLTLTATSSNQTLIPDANITKGGAGANRSICVAAAPGQTGTAIITVGVSDGEKKTYTTFNVTVNPDAQIGSELVTNGGGNSVAGWYGETSRYNCGSAFTVGSLPGGSTASYISQDINIGKFGAITDTELLRYNASATVSGGATYKFEGLDELGYNVLWTKDATQTNTILPAGTRKIRVTVGGPVGSTIKNISFKVSNTNLPAISTIGDREILAGTSTTVNYAVAYTGNSVSLSATSDNQTVIPNGNIQYGGSGYQRTITVTSVAGTSGIVNMAVKADSKIMNFKITVKSVPGAPTGITAIGGDGAANVSFTAPTNAGGSTISQYEVTANPGGLTATGPSSPINITGLTNGQTYTFTVKATNETGTGVSSTASSPILLQSVPGAPTITSASPLDKKVEVGFSAPASDGGSTITKYTVTSYPGGLTAVGTTSPLTVSGLLNGMPYSFKVVATNSLGDGAASAASSEVSPRTIPDKPTGVTATAGNASARVSFLVPVSDGGNTISGYTVTSSPGSITATGTSSPIDITGLTNGEDYTFSVTATNAAGTSEASDSTTSVKPMTVPENPTGVTATAGNGSAEIRFVLPTSNGGSTITAYRVTSNPGSITATGTSSPITISGLTNGTAYTFKVTAINKVGVSNESAPSGTVKPMTVPGKPTEVIATAGNGNASIAFKAPVDDGGSSILNYEITSTPGNFTMSGGTSPIIISGLENGTDYTFKVTATNLAGTGAASDSSASVMPDTPNYKVTYNLNGGTGTVPTETTKKENAVFKIKPSSIIPPVGMQFKEWNTKADGLGTTFMPNGNMTVGTENIMLYATWEIIPKVVRVDVNPIRTLLEKGTQQQLTTAVIKEGTATDKVNWTSSDVSGKVMVDNTGLVSVAADAVAAEYTITATSTFDTNKKGEAIIRVAPSLIPYNNALNEVKESDYFPDSWASYQLVVTSNKVTNANTQGEVDGAIKIIKTAQKDLAAYPMAKDIKTANVLIIGQYAFELGDDSYNLSNYGKAASSKYKNPTTTKEEIYYFAGGKWYDLVKNDGRGLVDPIDPNLINGNGKYTYWNMTEKRP